MHRGVGPQAPCVAMSMLWCREALTAGTLLRFDLQQHTQQCAELFLLIPASWGFAMMPPACTSCNLTASSVYLQITIQFKQASKQGEVTKPTCFLAALRAAFS
jgi:hypothetical protein